MKWKIRDVEIPNQLVLAPMAGVTNEAFRIICKEMHAGLVMAEMVSDKAIGFKNSKTVNINRPNLAGITPLISFAGREISIEAISILLENGADVNMVDKDGETALSYAVENGNFEAALMLLENNANPNLAKKKAKDLANIARELGDEEVASILDKY